MVSSSSGSIQNKKHHQRNMVWMVCLKNTAKTPPKGEKTTCLQEKAGKTPGPKEKQIKKIRLQEKVDVFLFFGEGNMGQVMGRLIWLPKLAIQPGAGVWVQLRIASLKEI